MRSWCIRDWPGAIMYVYGLLVLSPTSVWNRSHDHHHKHNSKETNEHIGSFPVMTCEQYAASSRWQKMQYVASRHWLTIGLGYLTVFMGGMCIRAVILNPARHFDSALALVLHIGLAFGLTMIGVGVFDTVFDPPPNDLVRHRILLVLCSAQFSRLQTKSSSTVELRTGSTSVVQLHAHASDHVLVHR